MDYLPWHKVAGAAFLVFALSLFVMVPRARASANPSFDSALANCQAWSISAHAGAGTVTGEGCVVSTSPVRLVGKVGCWKNPVGGSLVCHSGSGDYWTYWTFSGAVPPMGCSSLPTVRIPVQGKVWDGFSFTQTYTDPLSGGSVQCVMTCHPSGPPVRNPSSGAWQTYCVASPSGNTAPGAPGWTDNVGQPAPGIPPPADPPADVPNPPKVCDGVSCYDPVHDQNCAGVEGGGQVCIPGSVGRGGPGGCASSGGSTLCAGAPEAPPPPPSQVPDPATQINGAGTTTHATPPSTVPGGSGSGGIVIVHTTTYGAPGSSANNGATTGDSQPAPPSSSGGAGTYGGGGSCETPPACTGDAVLCGIARTQWATTCQVHKDLAGTGPAPAGTVFGQGDVWVSGSGSDSSIGGQANQGIYNEVGFGAPSACPLVDKVVPLWGSSSFTIPFSVGCTPLGWLRYLVIGFALFAAAKITMGASN